MILLKKNNHTHKIYTIDQFNNLPFEEKYKIYEQKARNEVELYCDCNGQIPITLYYRQAYDEDIFLKNLGKKGEEHLKECSLHSQYISSGTYQQGYKTDEEGNLYVHLALSAIEQKPIRSHATKKSSSKNQSDNKARPLKVTLYGLTTRLITMSWHRYVLREKQVPTLLKLLIKKCYGTAKTIKFDATRTLQDYWYSGKSAFEKLEEKQFQFVLMSLISIKQNHKLKGMMTLCLYDYYEKKPVFIEAQQYMVDDMLSKLHMDISSLVSIKEGQQTKYRAIVSGFIKNHKGFMHFNSLCILPIIEQGLCYETPYEKRIYEHLIEEKRLFHKGYVGFDYYTNMIPTFYIDDAPKTVLCEVFSPDVTKEYKSKRIQKGLSATNITFWFWDVEKSEKIPPLPKVQTKVILIPIKDTEKFYVKFKYDEQIISILKRLKGYWNKEQSMWEIKKDKCEELIDALKELHIFTSKE